MVAMLLPGLNLFGTSEVFESAAILVATGKVATSFYISEFAIEVRLEK